MSSRFEVLFGDEVRRAPAGFYDRLTALEVEENADLPGAIQLTLPVARQPATGTDNLTTVGDPLFQPYARIAVVIKIDGKRDQCIFDGYVLSHKVHLDRGTTASSVQVWGQDASCLMNLEEKVREWKDSDGTIANAIFGLSEYDFATAAGNTQDDSGEHAETLHTVMQRGTDAQFLRDRARRTGKLFRVCCDDKPGRNTGYFIKPKMEGEPSITLMLNVERPAKPNVDALDFEWDVARPTEVMAKALVTTKDAVDGGAQDSGLAPLDRRSLAAFASPRVMKTLLTTIADSAGELRARAESVLREAGWFVKCVGETDLSRLPTVMRVGTLVQVNGAGTLHSGVYFVWTVHHAITAQAHRLRFVLVRNAVGA